MRNMLQRSRIVLAWLLMGVMVLTFGGIVAPVLPQWQFLPALLAGNLLVIAVIAILTLLLGRIYCSVLCPLGISQDFVFWLAKRRKKNRRKFAFRRERRIMRYSILILTGLAFLAGLSGLLGWSTRTVSLAASSTMDWACQPPMAGTLWSASTKATAGSRRSARRISSGRRWLLWPWPGRISSS